MKPRHFNVCRLAVILFALLGSVAHAETADVGALVLEVPAGFKGETLHHKTGPVGEMEVNSWRAADGRMLQILYLAEVTSWDGGGPMKAAKEEAIEVAGQETKLIETEWFYGAPKKVLVVYLQRGESTYTIVGERIPKDEFVRMLKSAKFKIKAG